MGSLQRAPGPPPTAFSQNPPRICRREQTSLVKNRMREICTSGSVRGEGGNILTYSAELTRTEDELVPSHPPSHQIFVGIDIGYRTHVACACPGALFNTKR